MPRQRLRAAAEELESERDQVKELLGAGGVTVRRTPRREEDEEERA
jgi:hypothetical protein